MEKRISGVLIFLIAFLNVVSGFLFFLLGGAFYFIAFILALLYIIFGISVARQSTKLKWLFYLAIIPLTISSFGFVMYLGSPDVKPWYRLDWIAQSIFIGLPLITCIGNLFLLAYYKAKKRQSEDTVQISKNKKVRNKIVLTLIVVLCFIFVVKGCGRLYEYYWNRGADYYLKGNFGKAILECNKAIKLAPFFPEGYYIRGLAYLEMREYDKSEMDARKLQSMGWKVGSKLDRPEIVMSNGMEIMATTSSGTIRITAGPGFIRNYAWETCTGSIVMEPRIERWCGSLGIYNPGSGMHWKECNGIARAVTGEGQIHFADINAAMQWINESTDIVYNSDGIVVSWSKTLPRSQLNVGVWQIMINGQKPINLPGAQDDKIKIRYINS